MSVDPGSRSAVSFARAWLLAIRARTLLAAAGPVLVGTAAASSNGVARWGPACAALVGAILLQIGANLSNDVFDFLRGSDTDSRVGPIRVTSAGILTPRQMMLGMWVVFGASGLVGAYLTWVSGWLVMIIGIVSIGAAITYSAGPFAYGYRGMGDPAVFLFFGVVAVTGTYYVQAGTFHWLAGWASVPVGLLATAILTVNNLRDIETDRQADKLTLAVYIGVRGTKMEYVLLLLGAFAVPLAMWRLGVVGSAVLLSWVTIPYGVKLAVDVWSKQGADLNRVLAQTAQLGLMYALFFSVGLLL